MEYRMTIGGEEYTQGELSSVTIKSPLFDKFGAGNACTAEMDLSYYAREAPPRAAKIEAFCRETAEDEWKQLGIFYIYHRETEGQLLHITAYDGMVLTERKFLDERNPGQWPRGMKQAADDIATMAVTTVDPRTVLNNTAPYTVPYPGDYTGREILQHIAAAHLGNWIVTSEGKFLLVPLIGSMPPETHYLIEEHGEAITFGGVRILV